MENVKFHSSPYFKSVKSYKPDYSDQVKSGQINERVQTASFSDIKHFKFVLFQIHLFLVICTLWILIHKHCSNSSLSSNISDTMYVCKSPRPVLTVIPSPTSILPFD